MEPPVLNVVDHGGQGSTMVLLHGFLGSGADWRTVLPGLMQYYRCVTVDLPGHGDSDSSVPVTGLTSLAGQIVSALAEVGIERFSLLGYSLGGRVALAISAAYPEQVERLFLEGANPGLQDEDERIQRRMQDGLWAERFRHEPLMTVLDDWYRQPVFASLAAFARSVLVRERSEGNNGRLLADILCHCGLAEQENYRRFLRRRFFDRCFLKSGCAGKGAVVYLVGEHDNKFLLLAHSLVQECGIDMHIVAAAGHNTHRDNPAGFIGAVCRIDNSGS